MGVSLELIIRSLRRDICVLQGVVFRVEFATLFCGMYCILKAMGDAKGVLIYHRSDATIAAALSPTPVLNAVVLAFLVSIL
jgi:hypothetical protein